MSSNADTSCLESDISQLGLNPEAKAVLVGSRVIEYHLGRSALIGARRKLLDLHPELFDESDIMPDTDIVVDFEEQQRLQSSAVDLRIVRHVFNKPDGGSTEVRSYSDPDGRYDIWRWWFDPALYAETGHGRIYIDELATNSTFDEKLGLYVLNLDYLATQKYRSADYLSRLESRRLSDEKRLHKDQADYNLIESKK